MIIRCKNLRSYCFSSLNGSEDIFQKKNVIYCLIFPNGEYYIGQCFCQTLKKRLQTEISKNKKNNWAEHNDGVTISVAILGEGYETIDEIRKYENLFIANSWVDIMKMYTNTNLGHPKNLNGCEAVQKYSYNKKLDWQIYLKNSDYDAVMRNEYSVFSRVCTKNHLH